MKLEDALIELEKEPVLIDDGVDYWSPDNLRDELTKEAREKEVYACDTYIADLDDEGYQITPHAFTVVNIGETPYFVERKDDGTYRVKLMEHPEQERSRLIYGQARFEHKQAAYRRKSQLNEDWQTHRILGA